VPTASFRRKFEEIVEPRLEDNGFTRLALQGCMCPEYLYSKGRLWFALSWDWRDRYLDVALGHLYWFKDVMDRVVVVGDYCCYVEQITHDAVDRLGDESKVLEVISSTLGEAILIYEKDYERILNNFRASRTERNGINIDDFLGKEVAREEIRRYEA